MWGKQKPHTDMYEVLTDSTNNFCASRRYVLISICFRFTIALRMEPCFFLFLNEMIDNKKSCKRWCLQDFSSSPSWARTNNPTVNSRVLYHWAIEDYSFFLSLSSSRQLFLSSASYVRYPYRFFCKGLSCTFKTAYKKLPTYSIFPSLPFPFSLVMPSTD